MKYCSNCGRKIKNNAKFCPYCGHRISNYNLHNVEKKLGPKHSVSPLVNTRDYNPKHISKKAKILFGCIIAAAIIGGAGIHHHNYVKHYNYEKTTSSVNLPRQMSDKSYHIGSVLATISDVGNNSHLSNSDKKVANGLMGKFHNGNVKVSYKGRNMPASDHLGYSIQGKDLSLNMSSDNSDYLNLNLKLVRTNESHKDLTFQIKRDSDRMSDKSSDENQQFLNNLIDHKITLKQN